MNYLTSNTMPFWGWDMGKAWRLGLIASLCGDPLSDAEAQRLIEFYVKDSSERELPAELLIMLFGSRYASAELVRALARLIDELLQGNLQLIVELTAFLCALEEVTESHSRCNLFLRRSFGMAHQRELRLGFVLYGAFRSPSMRTG